jgi:hypothetical protein
MSNAVMCDAWEIEMAWIEMILTMEKWNEDCTDND